MNTLHSSSNKTNTRNWFRISRTLTQVLVFAALIGVPAGIFHMLCPFGGVTTLPRLVSQGLYVPKTGITNLILLGAVLASALLAGPVFCGWLCPLGASQDWVRAIAAKLGVKRLNVPKKADRFLSLIRYVLLGLILWATAQSFNLVFKNADPYYALLHFWTGEVAPAALVVLAAILGLSVFVARPWCRWFCPMGGILSLIGRFSIFKMRRPSASCKSCGRCANACPVGIDPSEHPVIKDPRCIRCGECLAACPPKLRTQRRSSRIIWPAAAAVLVAVFFVVPLFLEKGHSHGQPHPSANRISEPQRTETSNPQIELRAQSRLAELPDALGMSLQEIYALLELPEHYSETTRLIDIEDDFEGKTLAWIKKRIESLPVSG